LYDSGYGGSNNLGVCHKVNSSEQDTTFCLGNHSCNADYPVCVFATDTCIEIPFPWGFVDDPTNFHARPSLGIFDDVVNASPPAPYLSLIETDPNQELDDDGGLSIDGLHGATVVALSPDGQHVYAGGRGGIGLFQRKLLTGRLVFVEAYKNTTTRGLGLTQVKAIAVDANYAYVLSANMLAIIGRDPVTGKLASGVQNAKVFKNRKLHGGSSLTVTPSGTDGGADVYVAAQSRNAVLALKWDPGTNSISLIGTPVTISRPTSVALSPDGAYVYVASGRSRHESVSALARTATDGSLSAATVATSNDSADLKGIRSIAVSPDGQYVYAVGKTNALVVLRRNNCTSGTLCVDSIVSASTQPELAGAAAVAAGTGAEDSYVSDAPGAGETVYVASAEDVVMFKRDASTSPLQFVNAVSVSEPLVNGMLTPLNMNAVAVSGDGRYAYATGTAAPLHAIAAFWTTD
jgi:DNA-binding beta-propeller fold protein YncE